MKTTSTPSTIERQGLVAALALTAHMHEHQLGMFRSINAPTDATPYFDITIAPQNVEAWMASGVTVTDVKVSPIGLGQVNGYSRERVVVTGLLQPHNIRIALKYFRRATTKQLLSAVTDECFQ